MLILQANQIKKQYGVRTVLDFDQLQIYAGDRVGIVGRNGAGKTTLLKILNGDIAPDSGYVVRKRAITTIHQLPPLQASLSGGENAKQQIRKASQHTDQVLFADEPTANLDDSGVEWVRRKLLAFPTVLLISHDRTLLNDVCNRIIEVRDGALYFYTGNYADYKQQINEEMARQEKARDQYRQKKTQLQAAIQAREQKQAKQRQKKRRETAKNSSEARLGGHKRAASLKKQQRIAHVLEARVERLEEVERVKELPTLSFDFGLTDPPGNKRVIVCDNLHFAYGQNTVFRGASFTVENGDKVALTGKNGAGKSSLLRLIYHGCDAIRTVPKFKPGFFYQSFENLVPEQTVLQNVLSTSIQTKGTAQGVLAGLLFRGDDVYKKVKVLSGGEKIRLSIAKLIVQDSNALFLDEPTNYLDIASMQAVEKVLREYPGTLLLVSHDQTFVDAVATTKLRIEDGKIAPVRQRVPANPAQKTLLEVRQMQLLEEMSTAPSEKKQKLEKEYADNVQLLQQL